MTSRMQSVLGYVFLDLAGSVLRFPLWWYSFGLLDAARWVGRHLAFRWRSYGIALWMKQFFAPMYGTRDLLGRAISVFMRFIVITGRLIAYAAEALGYLLLLALWIVAPPACLWFFLRGLLP